MSNTCNTCETEINGETSNLFFCDDCNRASTIKRSNELAAANYKIIPSWKQNNCAQCALNCVENMSHRVITAYCERIHSTTEPQGSCDEFTLKLAAVKSKIKTEEELNACFESGIDDLLRASEGL